MKEKNKYFSFDNIFRLVEYYTIFSMFNKILALKRREVKNNKKLEEKKSLLNLLFDWTKALSILSVFTGILYQFLVLWKNTEFFSYSQVISDGISVFLTSSILLIWLCLSYIYINIYYDKISSDNEWNSIWIILNIFFIFGWGYTLSKYINTFLLNNLTAYFWLSLASIFFLNIIWHIIVIIFNFKFIKTILFLDKIKIKIIYIILFIILYFLPFALIKDYTYKDVCIIKDSIEYPIYYANDKYIFLKKWNKINAKDNIDILKIEDIDWFLREKNCGSWSVNK